MQNQTTLVSFLHVTIIYSQPRSKQTLSDLSSACGGNVVSALEMCLLLACMRTITHVM